MWNPTWFIVVGHVSFNNKLRNSCPPDMINWSVTFYLTRKSFKGVSKFGKVYTVFLFSYSTQKNLKKVCRSLSNNKFYFKKSIDWVDRSTWHH